MLVDKKAAEVQTDISLLERTSTQAYLCGDCEYSADCIYGFNEHTHSQDGLANLETSLYTCHFCEESFETSPQVMKHNKSIHTSSLPLSINNYALAITSCS